MSAQHAQPEAAGNSITVALPTDGKEAQANVILAAANALVVSNDAEFAAAAAFVQQIKANAAELDKERTEWKKPIDALSKKVQSLFKPALDIYATAESIAKRKLIAYTEEQRRIQLEEQRKADEAARKEQEKLRQQAARAAESGKIEKAEVLQQRAASVVAPVIQREPPKVAGITTRKAWKFEVTDPAQVPREYLTVDESKIRKVVAALGAQTNIPGVRVWSEDVIASAKGAA